MSVPMYLRVKRQNQCYFIMCQPEDTVGFVKEQVALANKEYKADQMRLIIPNDNTILADDDKLQKHEDHIKNEAELHVVFQTADGEWEDVAIAETQAGDRP
mmetsp:Transcript_63816/g.176385  ORF Transcript_63816/g.176385 Transcript_63816/m.176385 type:complete len:101 (+) Transcript_63816:96-398(+)